ncbi:cation:dicarboxylate symporter family transporter [Flexithrix dorotheae]|uniref:cation:dicarboxylate symporter family transporter n=1 Tax=Flexithrix dorotheae TaxID=70993 RepID=UPI000361C520|nr:cation:dicarboxylase symporter family transporter [Flexithrix dorotheae]
MPTVTKDKSPEMAQPKPKEPMPLSTKILIGLILGIATGLFFGEYTSHLKIIGDAFIGLLQMTVLPYIILSLIVNIGRLSMSEGKRLIINCLITMLILLGIGLIVIAILPIAFPEWKSANFYSTSFIEPPQNIDFLELFVPSNPFHSMSANKVPAVVLFCILIGVGLMRTKMTDSLLGNLEVLNKAINEVNKLVIKVTPYGVFAIAADTAGNMTWEDIGKLQAFILIYTIAVLILVFWFLPVLISSCTPFRYKDIFGFTKTTLITIFATGKIIIVLPQLVENIMDLYKKHNEDNPDRESSVEIIFPLAYPFPNLGSLVIIIFVPFAAWYLGSSMTFGEYPGFLGAGLFTSFVAPVVSIPFLLEMQNQPTDMFHLFAVSTVYTDRIRVILGAMYLITLTIFTTGLTYGPFKIKWAKLISGSAVTVLLFLGTLFPLKYYLAYSLKDAYNKDEIIMNMQPVTDTVSTIVLKNPGPCPQPLRYRQSRLSRIKQRKIIRIGFYEEQIPFTYFNAKGELVGFGVDMARDLAKELDVTIGFVPIKQKKLLEQMENDHFDLVMSDIFLSTRYSQEMSLSRAYLDVVLAFVVKNEINDYKDYEKLLEVDTLNIAYFERREIAEKIHSYLPNSGLVSIDSISQFFNNQVDTLKLDALLTSAERGAALTLLHPDYQVVNPLPINIKVPLVYPIAGNDTELQEFVSNWIEEKKKDGTIDKFYDHWILGKDVTKDTKHWSVIKDVLHWVE